MNISEIFNLFAVLGGSTIAIGIAVFAFSNSVKNHAEKFKKDNIQYIKPKINSILKKLYIAHIFEGLIEIDNLTNFAKENNNQQLKDKIKIFRENLVKQLNSNEKWDGLKNQLQDIVDIFILDIESNKRIKEKSTSILKIIGEHNELEELFEDSVNSEINESKELFKVSVGIIIIGLTIILYNLYGCTFTIIPDNFYSILIVISVIEMYTLFIISEKLRRFIKIKKKTQNQILEFEKESFDLSPIKIEE